MPAIEEFQAECFDSGVYYIMIDGPGINQIRKNPHYRARSRAQDDAEWRQERAMQAGMGLGIEAYNDELGYG